MSVWDCLRHLSHPIFDGRNVELVCYEGLNIESRTIQRLTIDTVVPFKEWFIFFRNTSKSVCCALLCSQRIDS